MSKDQRTAPAGAHPEPGLPHLGIYLLALMAWVTIVITWRHSGVSGMQHLYLAGRAWVYRLLNLLRDYIVFVCATVILAGWVVISYQFIARYAVRELEALADAAEQLVSPQDEPIPCRIPWAR